MDGTEGRTATVGGAPDDILEQDITAPWAWPDGKASLAEGRVELTQAAREELRRLAPALAGRDGPIESLRPEDFDLEACAAAMAEVRSRIFQGVGFALLDRMPLEGWDERTGKSVAWLLIRLVGPIVNQKWQGTRLYDVRDTGTEMAHGVRRSITNLEQEFHTDGGWLVQAPEVVCLACLRPAESGGLSRVASLAAAHNRLRAEQPARLARLYRPLWWDRQAEHDPKDSPCSRHPVFAWDGARLTVRYYDDYLRNGHRLMDEPLTAADEEALDALRAAVEAPESWLEFRLEPGQIEFVNNHLLAHARTAFEDGGEAGRHLLRLWIRREGGLALEPGAPAGEAATA